MGATYNTEKDLEDGSSIIIEVDGRHYMENEGADADGNRGHMEHGYSVENTKVWTADVIIKRKWFNPLRWIVVKNKITPGKYLDEKDWTPEISSLVEEAEQEACDAPCEDDRDGEDR